MSVRVQCCLSSAFFSWFLSPCFPSEGSVTQSTKLINARANNHRAWKNVVYYKVAAVYLPTPTDSWRVKPEVKVTQCVKAEQGFPTKNQSEQNSVNRELGWNEKERAGAREGLDRSTGEGKDKWCLKHQANKTKTRIMYCSMKHMHWQIAQSAIRWVRKVQLVRNKTESEEVADVSLAPPMEFRDFNSKWLDENWNARAEQRNKANDLCKHQPSFGA